MAVTDRDRINSAMGGSQDPNQDDYMSAMGGWQPGSGAPANGFTDSLFGGAYITDSMFNNDFVTGA